MVEMQRQHSDLLVASDLILAYNLSSVSKMCLSKMFFYINIFSFQEHALNFFMFFAHL